MEIKELKPRKVLNKAFLKVKPNRTEIEGFKANLITLLDRTNDTESEEFHKNLVSDFLKKTYYDPNYFINTKGRNDLVIHNGQNANSTVGVILEAKKPTNRSEMMTREKLNTKAFQELVLYYLRERITHKNLEVKHLVATNINEWFIFDGTLFDRLFAQDKNLVKQFNDFEAGRFADTKTDFFYKQIAEPFIDQILTPLMGGVGFEFTYFNIQDYQKPLRNNDKADDNSLIALFKLLSPEHLLKLPFTNDSNSLDKRFYSELLHIIGLAETKEGSKKLIERNKAGERHTGTILEDAIIQLDSLDKLSRLEKPNQFGNTQQERLFNVALELSITWINRILFLKLLEAQLITYHKTPLSRGVGGVSDYKFLNLDKIKNYDDLNSLFFQVLARKFEERNEDVKKEFVKVPYLNSSLFEPTDMEQVTLFISNLKDDKTIPIYSQTVLKDQQGKKRIGNVSTLQYLFEFLDAYDFGAEGAEEIQEDNKTLINASVLGLIFEKINGYKDGSFFTPGFITMYMCRETIRKAVVQKFNEAAKKSPLERGFMGVSSLEKGATRREIIPYNPKLKELARDLRNNSTKSEIILWKELKGKYEDKYDFHRQKPLDNYIADFFCYELKLVIEVDGETHNWLETQQKDYQKEKRLNELGLNVLRFPDSDIFKHLEATLETIRQYITGFEKGDFSELNYEDSPLNPLSGNVGIVETHSQPLSKETHPQPLSRGEFRSLDDVYEQVGEDRLFTRQQANNIVNSIKICDPAVGSGHFLVSALNEIIAVKNDLKILQDRDGKRLKEYQVEVVNDELIVTDEEGELFEYTVYTPLNPLSRGDFKASESQRIQETLFHEKQTIIENCLFGVDINSNSVKICRLRLWIELLKNAYYIHTPNPSREGSYRELQTLPNIDINIKCGNSLVSRFAIDADLKQALKKSKWTIDSYRIAVDTYRNAESKEQKREMERLIADIKSDFRSEISLNDPKVKKLRKLSGELYQMTNQGQLFEMSKKEKADWNKKVQQLTEETKKLETEIEEIKANKIFENAFEWRFEFPEVLNDDGDFVGFDVVIGNPPYVDLKELDNNLVKFIFAHYPTSSNRVNLYSTFVEKAFSLLNSEGYFSFIIPNSILLGSSYQNLRNLIKNEIYGIVKLPEKVFEDAAVETVIIEFKKKGEFEICQTLAYKKDDKVTELDETLKYLVPKKSWEIYDEPKFNIYISDEILKPLTKIHGKGKRLEEIADFTLGITPYDKYKGHSKELIENKEFHSDVKLSDEYKPLIKGENIVPYYVDEKENGYIKYGSWLGAPREERFFTEPRVIVRQIVSGKPPKIYAGYTDKPLYFTQIGFSIIPKFDITVFELTALLNSKLMNFYHKYLFLDIEKELFQKILIENCKLFPCRAFKDGNSVKAIIEKIIKTKASDAEADTTELETNLDKMIYELYELTEEEIKIIENN